VPTSGATATSPLKNAPGCSQPPSAYAGYLQATCKALEIYRIPFTWPVGSRPLSFNGSETGQVGHMGEIL